MSDAITQGYRRGKNKSMIQGYKNNKNVVLKKLAPFGNCLFLLFSVFKNNFLFLRLKNLFEISK